MAKRLLIFVTVLLVSGLAAGWYFFARESRYFGTSPLKAVPVESPFFVRVRKLGDFAEKTTKNPVWQTLSGIRELSGIYRSLQAVDSLLRQNREEGNLLRQKELIVVPADSSALFLLEISSIAEKNKFSALVKNYFKSKKCTATAQEVDQVAVQQYDWNENGQPRRMALAFHRGLLLAGNSVTSLRAALGQLDKPSVLEDSSYLRVNKNATVNADLNIFLNHQTLPAYLANFFSEFSPTGILRPDYARWTEVDVIQKERQFFVNGFTVTDTARACYLDAYRRQQPLPGSFIKLFPASTTFFAARQLSAPAAYFEDFARYLRQSGKWEGYNEQLASLSKTLNLDISHYLIENWTGEAATVLTNRNLEDPADDYFLLLKIKSGTGNLLADAVKKWASTAKVVENEVEIADAARNNLWRFPDENFANLMGLSSFGSLKTKWMTAGDGYILFGATPGSIKRYLAQLGRNELLPDAPSYTKFAAGLARTSSFFLWCAPGHSLPFFEQAILPPKYASLGNNIPSLKKIDNIAWQWGYEKGMVFNSASLSFDADAGQELRPFWRLPLQKKWRENPQFISWQAYNLSKELVYQDTDNNLVAVDKDGCERWKVRLEGSLMGGIKTIDYRKNGEFQLLFNTKNAIHLIDRNGRQVKNFPLRLKSAATSEVAVFDYDGKKDYRFVVACRDRKVYNFDRNGKPTVGWLPKPTSDVVEFPSHHFRVGTKDYIVFFDHKHTYLLDRQGKERVKLKEEFAHSKNDLALVTKDGTTYVVTTDEQGKIRMMGFDGSVKKLAVGNFTSAHQFSVVDRNGDGNPAYMFLDKQELSMFDLSGNPIFSVKLPFEADQAPAVVVMGKEKLILVRSATENRAILVRKDGSIFDNLLPGGVALLTVGSFGGLKEVADLVAGTPDGILSNFQMVAK